MKVAELLERRRIHWQELEQLTSRLETLARRRMTSPELTRFATLYRAACADLALADAYQLPPNTVQYLHRLVGRAHNQLYRARKFDLQRWKTMLARDVPQRVSHDRCVQLAFVMFWGIFLGSMWLAYFDRDFAKGIVGEAQLTQMQEMHGRDHDDSGALLSPTSVAFYISHNTGIGLECFAGGVLVLPGIAVTIFNAAQLGAVFGFMARPEVEARSSFYQFVTAHGPFELTAIVLSAGAG
ncbi:MAG: stage II sporulation protein M, partial [Planctomycetales bacterium]|nr:stage II sporulation protein M [Planctomycetales bacterium]